MYDKHCGDTYICTIKSKDVQIWTQRPFPHWGLEFKSLEKMDLSKRKFVIRHASIQIQPPASCRPCPFGAYGGKVEDKLLDS